MRPRPRRRRARRLDRRRRLLGAEARGNRRRRRRAALPVPAAPRRPGTGTRRHRLPRRADRRRPVLRRAARRVIASDIIRAGPTRAARPWPRHAISSAAWRDMARALPRQPELRFEALWADADLVYALFTRPDPLLVSAPIEAGIYAALSPFRPDAALSDRAVNALWGQTPADAPAARPLLDHGAWPVLQPLLPRPIPNTGAPEPVELRPAPAGSILLR